MVGLRECPFLSKRRFIGVQPQSFISRFLNLILSVLD
jgi:hypothetical protein